MGQAPARIFLRGDFLGFFLFFLLLLYMLPKNRKLDRGVGEWGLTNPLCSYAYFCYCEVYFVLCSIPFLGQS